MFDTKIFVLEGLCNATAGAVAALLFAEVIFGATPAAGLSFNVGNSSVLNMGLLNLHFLVRHFLAQWSVWPHVGIQFTL